MPSFDEPLLKFSDLHCMRYTFVNDLFSKLFKIISIDSYGLLGKVSNSN